MDIWAELGRVIPVVVLEDPKAGPPLARALLAGGLKAIEVTLRTAAALEGVKCIRAEVPEIRLGLGTVRTGEEMEAARAAELDFVVSPGCTATLLAAARDMNLPWLPGVATVSEALTVREAGFTAAKLFPARDLGGPDLLSAWSSVLPDLRFCPTGGITAETVMDYLALPNVFAVGGSWLAPKAALQKGDWAAITALAATAVRKAGSAPA